jgi:hypothetical protein
MKRLLVPSVIYSLLLVADHCFASLEPSKESKSSANTQQATIVCEPNQVPQRRALLIGAHQYEKVLGARQLGPQNDVRLIEQGLKPFGFISQVLTDSKATKANALAEWKKLASDSKCGDHVFLMLGGAAGSSKNGQWHFFFEDISENLIKELTQTPQTIQGTWSDLELHAELTKLRARRAHVTVFIDALEAQVARFFTPTTATAALSSDDALKTRPDDFGSLTVVYAHGYGFELQLPKGAKDQKYYGALSFSFAKALQSHQTMPDVVSAVNKTMLSFIDGSKNPVLAVSASSAAETPLFHTGLDALHISRVAQRGTSEKAQPSGEVQFDGDTTRGPIRVASTNLSGKVVPSEGLVALQIAGRLVEVNPSDGKFTVNLPLRKGDNQFEWHLTYKDKAPRTHFVTLHSTGGQWQVNQPARSFALFIANEKYDAKSSGFGPLKTPKVDANRLAGLLKSRYGFSTELSGTGIVERSLMLFNADRRAIFRALDDLARIAQPEDQVLIFYAGHGQQLKSVFPNGGSFTKTYWVPSDALAENGDADWISSDDINTKIARIRARHVLVVSDSCYSGGLTRSGNLEVNVTEPDRYLSEMSRNPSRFLLASGGNHPVDDGQGHSPFARELINILQAPPASNFTLQQVFPDLQKRISNATRQVPELTRMRSELSADEGGAMVFFAR